MNAHELTTLVVSVVFLAYLWFHTIPCLRRDNFRSDIRRIRDELFDFIWKNGYSFDEPAYVEARQTLNGLLRLSNRITPFMSMVAVVYFFRYDGRLKDKNQNWLDDIADAELKNQIRQTVFDAITRTFRYALLEGATGVVFRATCSSLVLLARTFRVIRRLLDHMRQIKEDVQRGVLVTANQLGSPALSDEGRAILHCP
jgi:hypothetical protein